MNHTLFFLGMVMLQIVFVTYQYILFRRVEFLYYLLYTFLVTVVIFFKTFPQYNPLHVLIIKEEPFTPSRSLLLAAYALYFRFGRHFTETVFRFKKLNRQLIVVEWIFLGFALIDLPLLLCGVPFKFLEPVSQTIYFAAMPFSLYAITYLITRKLPLTSIYVIGSGLLLTLASAGFIDRLLISKQIHSESYYLLYIEMGIVCEFLFLNYGLIYKTKMLQKEKMKLEVEQQVKLYQQRMRISSDLHDEIGATLSGIALYSQLTKTQMQAHKSEEVEQSLERMQQSATEMVHKLSDIVWAVNPSKDSLEELWQKLDDYAREIASTKNIKVQNIVALSVQGIKLSMEDRRNIYLLLKESINNAVKYSDCCELKLSIANKNNQLIFTVSDNGKGFDQQHPQKGNGLLFMNHRAKELNAQLLMESALTIGTSIQLIVKYPNEVSL
jgi:signal transduction histidine kinase